MATLTAGEKARMYALGAIARGGATRGGYISGLVFVSIGGQHFGFGGADPAGVLARGTMITSLTITQNLDETPDRCSFRTRAFVPTVGQALVITLGSKNTLTRRFAGEIIDATQTYAADNPKNLIGEVAAVDYTWQFNDLKVTARYDNQSATAIVSDLVARFAAAKGFTAAFVAAGLPTIPEITFTNEDLGDAVTRVARRIGAYWYVDYQKAVHFFFTDSGQDPIPLTANHRSLAHVVHKIDRSQVLSRVYVEGRGSRLLNAVAIGDTMIPVDAIDMFAVAPDVFLKASFQGAEGGAQHLNFAGVVAGGIGSLVGPGMGPTGAPAAAAIVGSGLGIGHYKYAYTFVTGSGESLPSPLGELDTGQFPAPTTAPTHGGNAVGAGVTPGTHEYAATWLTATGETTPGPLAQMATTVMDGPGSSPTLAARAGAGVDPGLHEWAVTYVTAAGGETTPGPGIAATVGTVPPPAQIFGANLNTGGALDSYAYYGYSCTFIFGPGLQTTPGPRLVPATDGANRSFGLAGIPTGPPGTTARWIWRTEGATYLSGGTGAGAWSGPLRLLAAINDNTTISYFDAAADTALGGVAPTVNTAPQGVIDLANLPIGPAGIVQRKLYRTPAGLTGAANLKWIATINDNTSTTYTDTTPDSGLGGVAPTVNTAHKAIVTVNNLPIGPAGTTARRLYRTVAGVTGVGNLKLIGQIPDNTTTSTTDTTADGALGAGPPTVNNTAGGIMASVSLSAIAIGPSAAPAVTARKIYRTVVNGAQLKVLAQINNNTDTTLIDASADGTLGANAPSSDTSGITQPAGQVPAGSTALIVSNVGVFSAAGGWAIIGNGDQVVRYTGRSASALTGIPATGIGAMIAAVAYNSTVTAAPMLTGIPASGDRSISKALTAGDEIYCVVTVDDAAALALLGRVREEWIADRRLSIPEARARGQATLALRGTDARRLSYTSRDLNTAAGKTITVNLPAPTNLTGAFKIQTVTIANFRPFPTQYPTCTVEASSTRYSFEDLLRSVKVKD